MSNDNELTEQQEALMELGRSIGKPEFLEKAAKLQERRHIPLNTGVNSNYYEWEDDVKRNSEVATQVCNAVRERLLISNFRLFGTVDEKPSREQNSIDIGISIGYHRWAEREKDTVNLITGKDTDNVKFND